MKKWATTRDTEAGQLIENFLDGEFTVEGFAEGYESMFDAIDDVGRQVDKEASVLLEQIEELKEELSGVKDERDELETKVTYLENIINDLNGGK